MIRAGQLITGTVRGRRGAAYVVVLRDGERIEINFEGAETPQIGADVIGVLAQDMDGFRMRLVPDVTRMLLKGRTRIIASGRPDMTARMLASLLIGSGPAAIRAGTGGLIERTPTVEDPDLAWALALMEPLAQKAGVALNVIDPLSLARSDWSEDRLRDETLPADASGETAALRDIKRLLADGMRPNCGRTVELLFGEVRVPSVDFIMPYSPLATGFAWSAEVAGARRNEIVGIAIPAADTRRFSALREMSLAFAHRYLGDAPEDAFYAAQLEACFADAVASLAFLNNGGSADSILRLQKLREAGLARSNAHESPAATSSAIAEALRTAPHLARASMEEILVVGASIAHNQALRSRYEFNDARQRASDRGVFVDLSTAPADMARHFAAAYRADVAETAERLGRSDQALDRLERFGGLAIPIGFEEEFDAALYAFMPERSPLSGGLDLEELAGTPFESGEPAPAVTLGF